MKNKKNFLVIGNPIKHSLSPMLHSYWFRKNKMNYAYKKLKIANEKYNFSIRKRNKAKNIK